MAQAASKSPSPSPAQAKQPLRPRHVPKRSCIACRQTDSKRTLVRIVRGPQGGVRIDPTGKLSGRGAYLCPNRRCWQKALKSSALNRALKTTLTDEETAVLRAYADGLPETSSDSMDAPEATT